MEAQHLVIPQGNWSVLRISCVSSSLVAVMMNSIVICPSDGWSQWPPQHRSILNRSVSLWINPINHCKDLFIQYNTTGWPVSFFQEGLHIGGTILWATGQMLLYKVFTTGQTCAFQLPCSPATLQRCLYTKGTVSFYCSVKSFPLAPN